MARAVFLDRDGVLNGNVPRDGGLFSPRSAGEFRLLPGVAQAVAALKTLGFACIVVTNQPDVARGRMAMADLQAMHERLAEAVPVDAILVCPHDTHHGCDCRKPKAGLLRQAAATWAIDLAASWMVGDRPSDIEAGRLAGCRTIFIGAGANPNADFQARDLTGATRLIAASRAAVQELQDATHRVQG